MCKIWIISLAASQPVGKKKHDEWGFPWAEWLLTNSKKKPKMPANRDGHTCIKGITTNDPYNLHSWRILVVDKMRIFSGFYFLKDGEEGVGEGGGGGILLIN